MSVGDTAPQSNTTNGPPRRSLVSWIALANTPLPVPVSPSSKTGKIVGANRSSMAKTRRISSVLPTASPNESGASAIRVSRAPADRSPSF